MDKEKIAEQIDLKEFCQINQINYLGFFGSFARGEERSGSDIDILVDFDETKSLFEMAAIKLDLEKKLGKEVDLAMKKNLKPSLEQFILKDLITLYEKR